MKIKLEIELELPDETPEVLDAYQEDIGQVLYDAYINYASSAHFQDAVKWCSRGNIGSDHELPSAKKIFQYHNTWGEICSKAQWTYKVIEDV